MSTLVLPCASLSKNSLGSLWSQLVINKEKSEGYNLHIPVGTNFGFKALWANGFPTIAMALEEQLQHAVDGLQSSPL